MCPLRSTRAFLPLAGALLFGCATPSEIKTASQKQLDSLDALDQAVKDLERGFSDFHRQKAERIRDEGRILIARQAIDVMVGADEDAKVTIDQLFTDYTDQVQPWLDYAFAAAGIDARIAALNAKIEKETDVLVRGSLEMDLEDLQLTKAKLDNKPSAVKQLEATILQDLDAESTTQSNVARNLGGLRAQIAVMKQMATRIDRWLAIDVTVSQEQADALVTAVQQLKESTN